jgi:hypothetical protein
MLAREVINSAETKANCIVKTPVEVKAEGSIDLPENDGVVKPISPSTVFTTITIKSVTGKRVSLQKKAKSNTRTVM